MTTPSSPSTPAYRFEFLDGLRGIMAVYVCLFHIREESIKSLSPLARLLTLPFHFGHAAVCVFIVLSGFVLMAPVARNQSVPGTLPGGLARFVQRRARRILPPYYAAFALTFLMGILSPEGFNALRHGNMAAVQNLLFTQNTAWHFAIPHLLLIHNWGPSWGTLDYPLWSVALEWQLYFCFPLIFLPLLQRVGITALVAVVWLVSSLPTLLLPYSYSTAWTFPWLAALFCLGMLGALACFAPTQVPASARFLVVRSRPGLAVLSLLAIAGIFLADLPGWYRFGCVADLLIGIVTVSFIVQNVLSPTSTGATRFLTRPAVLTLGAMSYSIYLIHKLVLIKFAGLFYAKVHVSPAFGSVLYGIFGVFVVLIVSWCFHLAFERPFMKAKPTK